MMKIFAIMLLMMVGRAQAECRDQACLDAQAEAELQKQEIAQVDAMITQMQSTQKKQARVVEAVRPNTRRSISIKDFSRKSKHYGSADGIASQGIEFSPDSEKKQ